MSSDRSFSVSSVNTYSQALYELAKEDKSLDQIELQVSSVINLISNSKDFKYLIKDPTIKQDDQSNIINLIAEKFNFNPLFKKFLNFLINKRRMFFVESILRDFIIICSNMRGEILAKLTAAKELNNTEIDKIKNELTKYFGLNVILKYKYDPNLIGGLIIQVGSVMIDTSIKNKLNKIETKMIEA